MHQIILITAMSATTGLFGGGKHCAGKVHHVRAAHGCSSAVYSAPLPCGSSTAHPMPYTPTPASYPGSPQMPPAMPPAPASAPMAPPVPPVPPAPTAPPAPTSASYTPGGRTLVYQASYGPTSVPCAGCATR